MTLNLQAARQRAFTLIEVVISSALMALILVSAYLCLNGALKSKKLIEPRNDILQNARVAMAIVTADLRCACALEGKSPFLGLHRLIGDMDADNIDFATHNYTPKRAHEGDYCEESIYLDADKETGQFSLWRRRNPTIALDPLAGGEKQEIATGLAGVRFEYFDGVDWFTTWGTLDTRKEETSNKTKSNMSGMPDAVRVIMLFDSNPKPRKATDDTAQTVMEPPFVFQTVVQLNLKQVSTQSTTGGNSGGGGNDNNAQPQDGSQTGQTF